MGARGRLIRFEVESVKYERRRDGHLYAEGAALFDASLARSSHELRLMLLAWRRGIERGRVEGRREVQREILKALGFRGGGL